MILFATVDHLPFPDQSLKRFPPAQAATYYWDTSGNTAAIDTIPFFFPKEKSPGGREWDYHNNAESFLLTGEATGKAMIELQKRK